MVTQTKTFHLVGFLPQETVYRNVFCYFKIDMALCNGCGKHYSPVNGTRYSLERVCPPLQAELSEQLTTEIIRDFLFPNMHGDIYVPCMEDGTSAIVIPKHGLHVISEYPEHAIHLLYKTKAQQMSELQKKIFYDWGQHYSAKVKGNEV